MSKQPITPHDPEQPEPAPTPGRDPRDPPVVEPTDPDMPDVSDPPAPGFEDPPPPMTATSRRASN